MTWRRWGLLSALLVGLLNGCSWSGGFNELVVILHEHQIPSCLYLRRSLPSYARGIVYAQTGTIDCLALWRATRGHEGD